MENKNEWRKIKLGEVAEYISEKINSSILEKKNYISTENMLPNNNGITLASSIPINTKVNKFQEEDILISNIRTYLKKIWRATFNGGSSNDVLIIRKTKNNILSKYIYYTLTQDSFFNYATATSKGTKMPRGDKDSIMNYEFLLPSLQFQKKIVKILSDIDEKIELNNKINDNLENLLKIIHNKFINGITGENNIISKIIDITDGTHNSPKAQDTGYPLVTSKHLLAYGVNFESINLISKEDYIEINKRSKVDTGDILISMIGTVGLVSYVINSPINFAIKNVALFKTSKNPLYKFFILGYLKSPAGINYIKKNLAGSTQKYISLSELRKMPIITPTKIQLKEYNRQISPIVTQISFLVKENEKLINLKNYLLPKLMNGEIDVEKIEL